MEVELGKSSRILHRKRNHFQLAISTGSCLHWGGIPGTATP